MPLDNDGTYYILCRNRFYLSDTVKLLYTLGIPFKFKAKEGFNLSISNRKLRAIRIFKKVQDKEDLDDKELATFGAFYDDPEFDKEWWEQKEFKDSKRRELAYYEKILSTSLSEKDCARYTVSTIHGVKGGEADNVVLLLNHTSAVEQTKIRNLDSELRCLYVALTRSKENLYIVHGTSRYTYNDLFSSITMELQRKNLDSIINR